MLRGNQEGLAHVVQESLSFVNVTRTRIPENRQILNLLVSDVRIISDQVANVTQMLDNRILQLETLLPMHLQLDALAEEIKQFLQITNIKQSLCGTPPVAAEHAKHRITVALRNFSVESE